MDLATSRSALVLDSGGSAEQAGGGAGDKTHSFIRG